MPHPRNRTFCITFVGLQCCTNVKVVQMLYKCFVFTGQLWNIYSIHIFKSTFYFKLDKAGCILCENIFLWLFQRYILLDYKKSNVHIQDLQYCGLSCLCYSIQEKVTLRPCCCDTDVGLRYIYWYRITCISYMKLGFPTFYGAK